MPPAWFLLPPSEVKTPGGRAGPLCLDERDQATAARARIIEQLVRMCREDPSMATRALQLPPAVVTDALAANAVIRESRTMPALRRYSGTLYDGLGFWDLEPAVQRLAGRRIVIFSGLLGAVRGNENVPLYRVPATAKIPGVGVATTYWRPILSETLPTLLRRGLIVDLRSSDYAAMWRPSAALRSRVLTVRVLSPLPRGGHGVISYVSKLAKGQLCAALIQSIDAGDQVSSMDDVALVWERMGQSHSAATSPCHLDLYTR